MGFFSKDSKGNKKLGATIVAVLVIALVLLAGPASAFNVVWHVPSTIVKGNSTSITVDVQRNTNDVYASNLTATVTQGSTTVSSSTVCDNIPLAGYGYGYLNKTKTESGYGYGYSYSYGSIVAGEGTISCTITFTPNTTETHTIKLMNGSTVLDTKEISVSSGSTGGGTTVTPGTDNGSTTTPTSTTEIIASYTATVNDLTESELREILSESNLTEEEINEYLEAIARGDVKVERTLLVEKIVENGVTSYKSTFTLTFKNNTGKDLKDVKIVEIVPKEIAATASEISSTYNYKVLIEDPVLEFVVPTVKAGSTATVTYTVDKQVTQAEFEAMDSAVAKYGEATTPVVPVTTPGTETPDTTTPPTTETPTTTPQGMDYTLIIVVIIILIIIGIAYYKREDIKKMMK